MLRAIASGLKAIGISVCFCIDTFALIAFSMFFIVWGIFWIASKILFFGGMTAGAIWAIVKPILRAVGFHTLSSELFQMSSRPAEEDANTAHEWRVGRVKTDGVIVTGIAEYDEYMDARRRANESGLYFANVKFQPYGLTTKFFYSFYVVENNRRTG